MRPATFVEKRVAITLSTNADYRTVGHRFGVSTASVCKIRCEVCQAIVRVLLRKYIHIPTNAALSSVLSSFARKGFPQCAGAIDGCHIPIEATQQCLPDYHNRKGWHSIILQGVVDHACCFIDINVGWPGRGASVYISLNSCTTFSIIFSPLDFLLRLTRNKQCSYCTGGCKLMRYLSLIPPSHPTSSSSVLLTILLIHTMKIQKLSLPFEFVPSSVINPFSVSSSSCVSSVAKKLTITDYKVESTRHNIPPLSH